ncbi:hypothetical protein RND81_09G037000 [Saponaria officinalis]|uniref:Protein EMBRYONIC FLOWER 1 n=1 Tax=Saponaria officinalis TaxID=3572 RepID=A0AAW1IGD3_SAPOF
MASSVVELNQQSDSSLPSKSSRLNGPLDLVPVQNPCDEKHKEAIRKCNHFSIRGYVSEVRKKDPKLCYPFTVNDTTDPRLELPPMVVPNFRWWRCVSCVPEAKTILKNSGGAGNEEAQNDANANASILLLGQTSKVDNEDRIQKTDASTSSDSNDNKNVSPISADRKGKGKAHVNDDILPSSDCGNGFLKVSLSQRILQQTLGQTEVDPSAVNEVEFRSKSNQNGTTKALQKDCKASRTEVGPSQGYVTREVEQQTSSQHQRADSLTNAVAGIVSTSRSHSQSLVNLPDLNECSGEPSCDANNEVKATTNNMNHFCDDDDDYLGAERRKKPKVRLLSELLGIKEIQNPAKGKKKTLSSASSLDESMKRKRVGSQDEVMKRTNDGTKKVVGTSDNSESEDWTDSDDVSTEKISETLVKRGCKSKDPSPEKRNKKMKKDHGESSLFRQKIKSKSGHEKGNISGELPQNLDFFTRLSEKNSVLTKKRGKLSQGQKEPSYNISSKSRMPNECGLAQKDGKTEQNATESVRKASENGHYFLSSYLNKENDQLCVPRKDALSLSSSQAEQVHVAGNSVNNDKLNTIVGETSVTIKPIASGAPCIGDQTDAERSVCPTPTSSEKKTETPQADGCSLLPQLVPVQAPNSNANQKELTNEVRGRIQDIDINSIPTDDKTVEQGPGDDIPMDIVELMAKNQYERHLDDPKEKRDFPPPPPPSGTCGRPNGNLGSYRHQVQNFAPSHFLSMQKPPSTDPRIPLFNENLGHYTYYNNNHIGVRGLPREHPVSGRFVSPSQAQDHIRPFSARGLTPNNWNGNLNATMPQRYPPSFLQAVDSYQKHRGMAPRQSITDTHRGGCGWPSGMTSRMPLGITNPQMISQSSSVVNKGRIHQQSSGSFLNFNANAAAAAAAAASSNLEKHQNLNFSNAYNSGNPESSARLSVDVNEAIPAMHLLSLMQNAAKLQNTELSLGPQKMVGPSNSRYPFSKNNNRTTSIQDNSCHPCYPTALPTARPFPLTYQNDGNISRTNPGFLGPIPLTLRGQRNIETSHFVPQSGDHRPLKRPMAPPHDKGKGFGMTKHAYMNNGVHGTKDSSKLQRVAGTRRDDKVVPPAPDKVICQLNRNPSEFNDLKLVAKYMIGPDDLKPRNTARDKAPRPRGNSKRQNNNIKDSR